MNKTRVLNLVSGILNLALVGIAAYWFSYLFGAYISYPANEMFPLIPFTRVSNLLMALIAVVALVYNIRSLFAGENKNPAWLSVLYLIGVTSVTLTFLMVMCYLGPTSGFDQMLDGAELYFHLISPILAIVAFSFFLVETSIKWWWTFLGLIPMLIYGIIYVTLNLTGHMEDIYNLMKAPYISIPAVLVGTYAVAFVLWLLNKLMRLIIVGYVYTDSDSASEAQPAGGGEIGEDSSEKPLESPETAEKPVETITSDTAGEPATEDGQPVTEASDAASEKKPSSTTGKYKDSARVYHVSRAKLVGKWQVKLATGEKAIKLFDTQLEAINYAKQLVRSQGGSIRIHSMRGQLRKG